MLDFLLFTGNANVPLANKVAANLSIPLGKALVSKFKDGEVRVEYLEPIYNKNVVLLQSTNAPQDTNLMELLLLADAASRGGAKSITAIIPYLGYTRQDKCIGTKPEPIAAKLIAKLLEISKIGCLVTINLHSAQTLGFFEIPIYNLDASTLFMEDIALQQRSHGVKNFVIVSPDAGGVTRAKYFAQKLHHVDLAFINKTRPAPNVAKISNVVGNVEAKDCILIDDMIDTGGTLIASAAALKNFGANRVIAYCTHPVLSDFAVDKIQNSGLDELVVADTIKLSDKARNCKKIRQFSIASIISEMILKLNEKKQHVKSLELEAR